MTTDQTTGLESATAVATSPARTISDVESDLTGAQVAHEAAKTALDAAILAKTDAEAAITSLTAEYRSLLAAASDRLTAIEAEISGAVQSAETVVAGVAQTVEQGAAAAVQAVENAVTEAVS